MNTTTPEQLERLNALLRGEIAAAETYEQVLDHLPDEAPEGNALRDIQREHGAAIGWLHEQVKVRGGEPATHSGAWGRLATAAEGAALRVGESSALQMLREGEKRGLTDYEDAAAQQEVPPECRPHVMSVLIPQQRQHVEVLTHLLGL